MSNLSTDSSRLKRWIWALVATLLLLPAASELWLRRFAAERDTIAAALIEARYGQPATIILGDSHTFALGGRLPSASNLSIPGASIAMIESLADLVITRHAPRQAIIEAGPQLFSPAKLNIGDGGLSDGWTPLPLFLAQAPLARRLIPSLLHRRTGPDSEMAALGVGARWDQVSEGLRTPWTRARVQHQRPSADLASNPQFLALQQLVRRLQHAGTSVCLVRMPVTTQYQEEAARYATFASYETTIKQLVTATGARWVDSSGISPPLELGEFLNQDHLNSAGADRYAPWLSARCGTPT